MLQQPTTARAMQSSHAGSGWGPWTEDTVQEADLDGPGLLVSRAFWIGGGLSLVLWGGVTALALRWF